MSATSLPTYLHLGKNAEAVSLESLAVNKMKVGAQGFPAVEVDALIAAKNVVAPAEE